jgi:hypothetical protein
VDGMHEVAFVLPKSSHNSAISTLDVNRMC